MKKSIILFAIFTFLLSISEINLIIAQSHNVAYIYNSDSSNGISFSSFLNSNSYPTSLIKISNLSTTNFDNYNLIIIDSKSGKFGNWGTPQDVQIIQNLIKPILALGRGGSSFYEQMGLSINWGNSWNSPDTLCNFQFCTNIFAEDTLLSVFNTPHKINFPEPPSSPIIQLYNNSAYIGVYKPVLSDTVLYIGRQPDDMDHYSIVAEGELYWLWGFDNSPASMTQTGKELIINIIYHLISETVRVNEEQATGSFSFELHQNYPNPFNPSTTIQFSVPSIELVTLKVYDVLGNEVATLVNEEKPAGSYEVEFNAADLPSRISARGGYASGIYFYKLQAGNYIEMKKMILLK